MRSLVAVLLILSDTAHATVEEEKIIADVVYAAKVRHYDDKDTKWAVLSNVFPISILTLCTYIPFLDECYE
jgi:hypothetical protein